MLTKLNTDDVKKPHQVRPNRCKLDQRPSAGFGLRFDGIRSVRNLIWTISAVLIGGCAANSAPPPKIVHSSGQSGVATALVFDSPITFHDDPIDLDRSYRGNAAFAGFEEPSVSYLDVFTENRQSSDGFDFVTRDSFSEKVGVVHR